MELDLVLHNTNFKFFVKMTERFFKSKKINLRPYQMFH
jgi:hypothetical protein